MIPKFSVYTHTCLLNGLLCLCLCLCSHRSDGSLLGYKAVPSSDSQARKPLNQFSVRSCQLMTLCKPMPYTFIVQVQRRAMPTGTSMGANSNSPLAPIQRMFYVDSDGERAEWVEIIKRTADGLTRRHSQADTFLEAVRKAQTSSLSMFSVAGQGVAGATGGPMGSRYGCQVQQIPNSLVDDFLASFEYAAHRVFFSYIPIPISTLAQNYLAGQFPGNFCLACHFIVLAHFLQSPPSLPHSLPYLISDLFSFSSFEIFCFSL